MTAPRLDVKWTDTVNIPTQVMARRLGEETVLLDLANGTYYGLDPVGSRIWQLMSEGESLNRICDRILDEYEVSRETLEADVLRLIGDLHGQGLVRLG